MTNIELRTGGWHDDRTVVLTFPTAWDVVTYWPDTPLPLDDQAIEAIMASPVGQPPLRELARGKTRPLIIVDDTSRPTPVARLMPFLLRELGAAGVPATRVRVLVATGTHGKQDAVALKRKLGKDTFSSSRVLVHRDWGHTKHIGVTSAGTPVYVNPEVGDSDLILGVGGIYPQHTTGFGGGAKLALGVLGRKTIARLHLTHPSVGGTYRIDNDFRRDLTEIARLMGLGTMFTLFSNANRQLVHLICGDHFRYYDDAVAYTHRHYDAPLPSDADLVVANAHPSDDSVYFMRKAMAPVEYAPPSAVKVMVASNHAGLGFHGIYYPTHNPRLNAHLMRLTWASIHDPATLLRKLARRVSRRVRQSSQHTPTPVDPGQTREAFAVADPLAGNEGLRPQPPAHVWVYAPPGGFVPQRPTDGMTITDCWDRILDAARTAHPGDRLRVRVYACGSLQCFSVKQDPH
jgi:nickel-dependent lactate racemase